MDPLPKPKTISEFYLDDKTDRFKAFNQWCKAEGAIHPKLEFPVYFEGGLLGARCRRDIQHREGFIYIPYKMLLSVGKA